jgi:ADP-ribose pyrophosphatase YjhB (NUDIX family)
MNEPKFVPKEGQVDYSNIRYCPVINCVLKYQDKILLVQRSKDMRLYPNYWAGVSGFLDDHKSVSEKALEELSEELGLTKNDVESIESGRVFSQEDMDSFPNSNKS